VGSALDDHLTRPCCNPADTAREVLFWALGLLSGGIVLLFAKWYPAFHARLRYLEVGYHPDIGLTDRSGGAHTRTLPE
jgi:hypothetical protein